MSAVYLSDPAHRGLLERYAADVSGEGLVVLQFTAAWGDKHLPPAGTFDGLVVTLLDATDGKTYQCPIYAAFEGGYETLDGNYQPVVVDSLQRYFYRDHTCACHRKGYAGAGGADTDEECEGDRFAIQSVTCPALPGLVLYSETMTAEQLEATLAATVIR